ncbi:DASS family sodium-coupled anion symporter [Euzebya sp.]|uniref:DASS family sodium-coupled anion symporter n=1 Tax=Euzebya sp. TaxID=1971409 RepID=UPI003511E18A
MSAIDPSPHPLQIATRAPEPVAPAPPPGWQIALRWIVPIGIGALIRVFPVPDGVEPAGWSLLAVFVATIAAIIAKPAPMGVVSVIGLTFAATAGILTIDEALSGFGNSAIWLIVLAFFIARGFIKTGLGARIAFLFVKLLGKRTVGLAYGLAATDLVLSPAMPSTTARAGGVIFPILRSLASAFESEPNDPSATRMGSYLTNCAMQVNAVTGGMFATAMAANPIIVDLATEGEVQLSWGTWALAAIVPGLVALAVLPLVILKLDPPEVRESPGATEYAKSELASMGTLRRDEKLMLGVFGLLLGLWMLGDPLFGMGATVAAMIGLSVLLVTDVLTWEDIKAEKGAWDTLVWFAVLVTMAKFLSELGVIGWFSDVMSGAVDGFGWPLALAVLIGVYVYGHYFFASMTAQVTAMYAAFMGAAVVAGAPAFLAAIGLAVASNLMGGLTHYASGPAPVLFGAGYMSVGKWWTVGLVSSIVTLGIFGTVGVGWTKLLGLW